jgi:uncharacterized membrane protein YphA (DoxX/SURF4 family)
MTSTTLTEHARDLSQPVVHRRAYWIPIGLLSGLILVSGVFNVTHQPNVVQSLEHLGYPVYLATLLGVWKILAALAFVFGSRWPRLQEWAFAGLFFDLSGAIVAHVAVGDPIAQSVPAAVLLVLTGVAHRAHSRRALAANPDGGSAQRD